MKVSTKWTCALLVTLACLVIPTLQQRRPLDLVFVVDGSDSVGEDNFDVVKQSVLNYVLPQMGDGVLEAGFVLFSTNLNAIVNLTPDPTAFSASVNDLAYTGGETNTNLGMQWGLSVLMTTTSRPGIAQAMIVIVDGVSRFPSETESVAQFIRDMGVATYAIGVGGAVTQEELSIISGNPSRVFTTPSFAALPSVDIFGDGGVTVVPTPAPTTTPQPTPAPTTTPQPTPAPTTTPRPTPAPTTTPRPTPAPTTTPRPTPSPTTTPRPTPAPTTTPRPTPAPTTTPTPAPTTTQKPTPAPTTRPTRPPTTVRPAPTTPYTEPYLEDGLCEDSVIIDGIGYRNHPAEADKYIMCYFPFAGLAAAIIRECPFGLLWNQHSRLCEPYQRVWLKRDPCGNGKIRAHPFEGNCRTFYNCEQGRSVPRCCPPGYLYDALTQGCSPCAGCSDPCPNVCTGRRMACNKYPEWTDFSVYRKWTKDGYVLVPCENGTTYDVSSCGCVKTYTTPAAQCQPEVNVQFLGTGVDGYQYDDIRVLGQGLGGLFDGDKARVRVETSPATPYDKMIVFIVYYRESETITGPQALLSSGGGCAGGGLFLVSVDRDHIKIEMSSYGHTPIIMRLPTAGFKETDEKQFMIWHIGDYLTAFVKAGGLLYEQRSKVAVLPYLNCGLDVGNSDWMPGFKGTIRSAQYLRCLPDNV